MLSSNQLRQNAPQQNKLCIWVFHDARPGHLSQLEGLVKRLAFHQTSDIHWINVNENKLNVQHLLFLPSFVGKYAKPDLILGAGHSTHTSVLIAGFKYNAFTAIIMKPSLPIALFNAIICPLHDGLTDSHKVLTTFGPINKIDKTQLSASYTNKTINLILIGGLSKHFHFDTDDIIEKIKLICSTNSQTQWLLSNSPRTPQDINDQLNTLNLANLRIKDYKLSDTKWLQETLLNTQFAWITPDSMSMIFEALSAESRVGLISCKAKKNTRIAKQITQLIEQGYVTSLDMIKGSTSISASHKRTSENPKLKALPWEADRAAIWLLRRLAHARSPYT